MKLSTSISLIMTVYNKEDYIEKTLNSIFSSTMLPHSLIIIDDGSTDRSAQIIATYQHRHPQLEYERHENRGVAKCRNEGIAKVTTDYFLFVDADDLVIPTMIERLDKKISLLTPDLVSFNYDKVSKTNVRLNHQHKPSLKLQDGPSVLTAFIESKATFDSVCSYLYNTAFIREHGFEFAVGRYHEDFGLIPWIILNANTIQCIDEVVYFNVMSDNSIMRTIDYAKQVKKAEDVLAHAVKMRSDLFQSQFDSSVKSIFLTYIVHTVISRLNMLNPDDQKQFIKHMRKEKILTGLPHQGWRKKTKNLVIIINPKWYLWMTQ